MSKSIIAAGLLTRENIRALGTNFTRIYPVDETPCFSALLRAIDEADYLGPKQALSLMSAFHPLQT